MKHGFTLIELSIVLVIIGLLAGGIVVGQTLIEVASLRKTIRQVTELQTQVHAFTIKYSCVPGDCAKASQFFSGAVSGNGNSQIQSVGAESANSFNHLSLAGLIPGNFLSYADEVAYDAVIDNGNGGIITNPSIALSTQFSNGFYANLAKYGEDGRNYVYFARNNLNTEIDTAQQFDLLITYYTNGDSGYDLWMNAQQAYDLDSKVDDGVALSGAARVPYGLCGLSGNNYDITNTDRTCAFMVRL